MTRKMVALLLVLMLCLTSVTALAAGPSKDPSNTNTVTKTKTTSTNKDPVPVIKPTTPTEQIKAEVAAIDEFVDGGKTIIGYFDENVQNDIKLAVPADVDAETLKMNEYIPLIVTGVISGSYTLSVSTAVNYADDDTVVTLLSYTEGGNKVWKVVACTISKGNLVIKLDAKMVEQIVKGSAALMILSDR